MRIIVAHTRLTALGGGERATLELVRRLRARHEVTLLTSDFAPTRTFAGLAELEPQIVASALWLAQPLAADAIIAQNFGARLLALRHHRVIACIHTMRSRYLLGGARPDLALRRALDRRALSCAAHLLANSVFTATRVQAFAGRAAEVVAPGADETLFALPPTLGEYALTVGRLALEKGVSRLLEWHAATPLPLEVVGAGSAADHARLAPLVAAGRARLRGPLTGAALHAMYAGARYFAFAPHAEEFGLVALDAMAAARPVIAAREGALPELVEDGVTGFLVRDAEEYRRAAERLLSDDVLCLRMGLAARERARAYTWERHAARIEALCEEVAARS